MPFTKSASTILSSGGDVVASDLTVDGTTVTVDETNNRLGVNTDAPLGTVGIDGDLFFQPTAISTSHIYTNGSLDIRCADNMKIATDGADSVRIGRANTDACKVFIRSGGDNSLVVTDSKVGIGMEDPSEALEVDGDIQLSPTAISTAHIKTAGSLDVRASANIKIGTDGADSVKIGRTNTTAAKVHIRSGGDNSLVVTDSKVGIGTDAPTAALEVSGALKVTNVTAGAWEASDVAILHGGTGASTAGDARANLGVAIGSDVQAYDADLDALSGCQSGGAAALAALTSTEIEILDGATLSTTELNYVDGVTSAIQTQLDSKGAVAGSSSIVTVGTVTAGTWNGTAIASAYLDADTAHLSGTQTFTGAKTFSDDVVISGTTPQLTIGDGDAEDSMLVFDGNAADFRIGIDDGTDTLEIGKGSAHGTTAVIKVDSSTNCQVMHNTAVADGEYSGELAMFTAGEDLTQGEVVYLKSDGKVWKAVATASATSRAIAMCVAPVSADSMGPFLIRGFARFDSEFPTYTAGQTLYTPEAETSGKNVPENAAPDTDGDYVQIIGYALSGDSVFMHFNSTVVEVA
tara:strand:- start:1925 stop:3652 length:1728 start_codon:yes stop_codon:yes gene_type:complete